MISSTVSLADSIAAEPARQPLPCNRAATNDPAGWSEPIQHLLLNEITMTVTLNGAAAMAHVESGRPTDHVRNLAPLQRWRPTLRHVNHCATT